MSFDAALAAEEKTRDLPAPPWVYGVAVFIVFVIGIVAVLMFGKGRPHS
jgi:uncharacterized membrane protein